jgi:CRISPR-associated endonuclease/helicase Cas3
MEWSQKDMLLAKSRRNGLVKTLLEHTLDVAHAGEALFGISEKPTRLGQAWLRFFQLDASEFETFLKHLRCAALAHDLGKANSSFQSAVQGDASKQIFRHEHLSGLLLSQNSLESAFKEIGIDWFVIVSAVISHHAKAGDDHFGEPVGMGSSLRIFKDSPDFRSIFSQLVEGLSEESSNYIEFNEYNSVDDLHEKFNRLKKRLRQESRGLKTDLKRKCLLAAVRTGLIVADAVGSASTRMHEDLKVWIRSQFQQALTPEDIEEKIIQARIEHLRRKGRWNDSSSLSDFQRSITSQGQRVLLTAPCGSGKTLAAWNWIKSTLKDSPFAFSRALFLYPTRATATEGFRDYVSWAPEDDAGFLTGTSEYELQGMFQNPQDDDDLRAQRNYSSDPRLFALSQWGKRIFSATADQFLPFLQFQYGPLCLTPLMAESIIIIDEVHSYDNKMFNTLRHFLKAHPSVPVLCMTATLPLERKQILVDECGLKPFPEPIPHDLQLIADYPRYQVQWIDRDQAKSLAAEFLQDQKRILWVSNRVNDCQVVYADYEANDSTDDFSPLVMCYHSRFKLSDRKARHTELVNDFQAAAESQVPTRGVFGITTQVCEMSLDLDAEVLFTELAPIESLIQRMGRCNRDSQKMKTRPPGLVYVLRPALNQERPYEKSDLDRAANFVDRLIEIGGILSQVQLEDTFTASDPKPPEIEKLIPFEYSGAFAQSREETFRDIDGFTVPCILDNDVQTVKQLLRSRKPIDGFILPVPHYAAKNGGPDHEGLPDWLFVASSNDYCQLAGYKTPRFHNSQGVTPS